MTETKSEKKQKKNKTNREVPLSFNIGYAIGEIPDMISYQGFSFLIFTFYSVVIGLPTSLISLVFIIWSIYNAFNDPLLGAISDRTKTKILGGGRRRPYIIAMVIPLSLIMFFLFTPPLGDDILTAAYMLLVMCIFDTVYTASSLNHTSLYPEMFPTDKAREEVGVNRRIFMVFGLLIAFVLPSVFVNEYVGNSEITILEYQTTGIVFGILIFITTLIHIKLGVKEPPLDEILSKESLSFKDSFKVTIKNRSFLIFIVSSCSCWYVFGLLPMIMPIYGAVVLEVEDAFTVTILLLVVFLVSIPGVIFWSKLDAKIGTRKAFIIDLILFAVCFLPYIVIRDYNIALLFMVPLGFSFGGPPYFIDKTISNIVDEDELKTKERREGAYYGVHAVFIRLATILVILSVNTVFSYNGWEEVDLTVITEDQVFGLQLLLSVFPATALGIGVLFLLLFPLNKEKVMEIQQKKKELYSHKKNSY